MVDQIEETNQARFRKLGLSVLGVVAVTGVQIKADAPMTWPVCVAYLGLVWAFVSADTLDKALQSGALGKLKEKITGMLPK